MVRLWPRVTPPTSLNRSVSRSPVSARNKYFKCYRFFGLKGISRSDVEGLLAPESPSVILNRSHVVCFIDEISRQSVIKNPNR